MKKHLMRFLAVVSVLAFIAACSSSGGGTAAPVVSPNGTVTVTPSSAFSVVSNGVSVSVPAGAYDSSVTKPTITVAKSSTLPTGATLPASGQQGDVYTITKDYANNFLAPVDITLPYDPLVTPLPMIYYWDATNSKYVAAAVQNIDPVAKTVTFSTSHFSTYVVMGNKNFHNATASIPAISTGFTPAVDGFFHPSFGTYATPGGTSFGMSDFSIWYFMAKKAADTNKLYNSTKGLYNKYREGDPLLYTDDSTARQLIGQAQNAASSTWSSSWSLAKYKLDARTTGLLLLASLQNSGVPQVLIMKAVDGAGNAIASQPVVVYGFTPNAGGTAGVFDLYDPNFPGEQVTLAWSLTSGFGAYGKAGAYSYTFSKFAFDGLPTVAENAQFNTLFTTAEATNPMGTIAVSAPTLTGSSSIITLSGATIPDQTVTGTITVPAGMAAPTYLKYSVNSGPETILKLTGLSYSFTIKGTGLNTTGNTISLTATSTLANPYDVKAFKQFTVSFVGTAVSSFINAGFENYSSIGSKGFSWKTETHLWSDVTARNTTGSPFPTVSTSPDTTVVNGSRADVNGKYYSPTGTVNPDYNPNWGFVTAYTEDTWKDLITGKGKSAVVSQGTDPEFKAFIDSLAYYSQTNTTGLSSLAMVFNGLKALRINNEDYDYHASSASQTALIKDPSLKFAWAAVLEDPGHEFTQQPYVEITVRDETAGKDLYHKHFFSGDPSYNGWVVLSNGWNVIKWQPVSLDVSSAIGHSVSIKVYASDCGYGGHGGYAYLDDAQ